MVLKIRRLMRLKSLMLRRFLWVQSHKYWRLLVLLCTFLSALSECSPRASCFLAQKARGSMLLIVFWVLLSFGGECNFYKLHSLSVAPEPLVFWYKKLEGLRWNFFKVFFWGYVPCSPRAFPGFFSSEWNVGKGLELSCPCLYPSTILFSRIFFGYALLDS